MPESSTGIIRASARLRGSLQRPCFCSQSCLSSGRESFQECRAKLTGVKVWPVAVRWRRPTISAGTPALPTEDVPRLDASRPVTPPYPVLQRWVAEEGVHRWVHRRCQRHSRPARAQRCNHGTLHGDGFPGRVRVSAPRPTPGTRSCRSHDALIAENRTSSCFSRWPCRARFPHETEAKLAALELMAAAPATEDEVGWFASTYAESGAPLR